MKANRMNIFYQSFLIRIWITDGLEHPGWHASLEDPHTRVIKTFQDPETLFNFLKEINESAKYGNEINTRPKEGNKNEET